MSGPVIDFTVPQVYEHFASYNPHYVAPHEAIKTEVPNAGAYDPYPNLPNYVDLIEKANRAARMPAPPAAVVEKKKECTCQCSCGAK
jgi:hypothetical protein